MSTEIQDADPHVIRANKLDLLERLADDLAHEIKNPLHSMVINLEVLKRRIARVATDEPDELLRYVGVLTGELERVNRRIELLLRLARPGRDGEATLWEVVEELLELVALEGERRDVAVRFEPAVGASALVPHEPTRQVILNLLLAGLDALPSGSTLRVSTDSDGDRLRLILEEAQAEGKGAAVGFDPGAAALEIARVLSEPLGGRIEVEAAQQAGDAPNASGLRFVFSLPTGTRARQSNG